LDDPIPTPPRRPSPGVRVLIAFAVALAAYLLLAQDVLWWDAHWILLKIERGEALAFNSHFLLGPVVALVQALLGPMGFTLFECATLVSAVSGATGVAFVCATVQRLPVDSANDLRVAALVATTPAVAFYSTVVEFHSLFFACAGYAYLEAARLIARPGPARAARLGLATALATLAHASGHLLLLNILPVVYVLARERGATRRPRPWIVIGLVTFAVHAAAFTVAETLVRLASANLSSEVASVRLQRAFGNFGLSEIPSDFLIEYLLPFFPLSILAVAALGWARLRPLALSYLASALPYVCLAIVMGNEHGAYALPISIPASLLACRIRSKLVFPLVLIASASYGIYAIRAYDQPQFSAEAARGVREIADGREIFMLVAEFEDLQMHFVHLPEATVFHVPPVIRRQPLITRVVPSVLDQELSEALDSGKVVLLTRWVHRAMHDDDFARLMSGRAVLRDYLDEGYVLEPVSSRGFEGWTITRKE
jgi:hypothetical protein